MLRNFYFCPQIWLIWFFEGKFTKKVIQKHTETRRDFFKVTQKNEKDTLFKVIQKKKTQRSSKACNIGEEEGSRLLKRSWNN